MHVQLSTGLKHQHTQNSRQLWGGWVVPTLYAISIQNKGISRDMGSAAEGQDSRAPACQDSTQ